jgi:hypothetical protein
VKGGFYFLFHSSSVGRCFHKMEVRHMQSSYYLGVELIFRDEARNARKFVVDNSNAPIICVACIVFQ